MGLMACRSTGETINVSLTIAEAASANHSAQLPKFTDPAINEFIQNADAAARVAAPSVSVTAPHTSESALPELPAPAVPDQLHLSVRDPLGDWTLDVRRHEHGLDLLFSAPGSLAPVVAGAEHDLRTLLASHGHSLASLDFQEQGRQGGREAPYTPEPSPRSANPGAQRATKRTSNSSSGTTSPGQKGINLNRVA